MRQIIYILITDSMGGDMPRKIEESIKQTDLYQLSSLLIRNIVLAIADSTEYKVILLSTPEHRQEYSQILIPEKLNLEIHYCSGFEELYTSFPDFENELNRYLFIRSTFLGFHKRSLEKFLNFLNIEEDICLYTTDNRNEVTAFASNKWDRMLPELNFKNNLPETEFLKILLKSKLRTDKLTLGEPNFLFQSLNNLQNLLSDRSLNLLNDQTLYKEFNLLFIEYKESFTQ